MGDDQAGRMRGISGYRCHGDPGKFCGLYDDPIYTGRGAGSILVDRVTKSC